MGGGAVVMGVEVDADKLAAQLVRGDEGRTGAGEGIEDDAARLRESGDQRLEGLHRLLRRMQTERRNRGPVFEAELPRRRGHRTDWRFSEE